MKSFDVTVYFVYRFMEKAAVSKLTGTTLNEGEQMLKLFSGLNVCLITLIVNWDGNKIDIHVSHNKEKSGRDIEFIQIDLAIKIHAVDLKHGRWG